MYTSELEALQSIQETYITMNELSTATLKSYKDKVHNTSGNDDRKAGSDMAYSKMVSHGDPKVQSSEIISKAKSEIKGLIDPKHHSKYPIDKITGYESARKIYKQAHSAGHLKEDVMDEKFAHPNHKKLDANDNGKVDAQDFALLRKKKGIKNFKEFKESLENLDEAHKIGNKVTIHKGTGAGITGHIGEISRKFKGDTDPTYTIYHGDNQAVTVNKKQIKSVKD
jgi:hypothetical protein